MVSPSSNFYSSGCLGMLHSHLNFNNLFCSSLHCSMSMDCLMSCCKVSSAISASARMTVDDSQQLHTWTSLLRKSWLRMPPIDFMPCYPCWSNHDCECLTTHTQLSLQNHACDDLTTTSHSAISPEAIMTTNLSQHTLNYLCWIMTVMISQPHIQQSLLKQSWLSMSHNTHSTASAESWMWQSHNLTLSSLCWSNHDCQCLITTSHTQMFLLVQPWLQESQNNLTLTHLCWHNHDCEHHYCRCLPTTNAEAICIAVAVAAIMTVHCLWEAFISSCTRPRRSVSWDGAGRYLLAWLSCAACALCTMLTPSTLYCSHNYGDQVYWLSTLAWRSLVFQLTKWVFFSRQSREYPSCRHCDMCLGTTWSPGKLYCSHCNYVCGLSPCYMKFSCSLSDQAGIFSR